MKLGKGNILVAVAGKFIGEQTHRLRGQALIGGASAIDFAQHQVNLQRPIFCKVAGEGHQSFYQLLGIIPVAGPPRPLAASLGATVVPKDGFPAFHITGNVGLTVGVQLQAGHKQRETRIGTKHRLGRAGDDLLSPERLVKALQAARLGKVGLLALAHP